MKYYVNLEARDGGTHIMHSEECQFLPNQDGRKALGDFAKPETALGHAKDEGGKAKGCQTCCSDLNG
ncbi:MAG: hypothetical protein AAGF60_12440 [Pseudomonadota bacterium]